LISRKFFSKLIALTVGCICVYIAYSSNNSNTYLINGSAYGTYWSITSTEFIADHHEKNIIKIINRVDMVASNYKPNSEIALLNQRPLETPIIISSDLYNILEIAKDINNISDGFYDISLGKISSKLGFAPSFNQDLKQDPLSDYLLLDNLTIIKSSNNWFDLSSIAKGYAVQLIHEYLIQNNLSNHLIDIGGELIINGTNKDLPWKVGIQNPAALSDDAIYIIENNNDFLSIATSGEYRNYKVNSDSEKISHTLNPKTLASIKSNALSVTVAHKTSATYADALATAFNAIGYPVSLDYANEHNIALMLVVELDNEFKLIFSNEWYNLGL
jgi:thiamine biosynthesis lipoprotein